MAKSKSTYRRLGGQGATMTYYARLYLGPDHLLQAASTGYSETYKRFYFQDIQAIIIRRTTAWAWWTAFWIIPALLLGWGAGTAAPDAAPFLSVIAGIFFIGLVFNLIAGPSCACHVQTAVQTEKLVSLKRLRKVRKILSQVRPLIAAVQGTLTADELLRQRRGPTAAAGANLSETGASANASQPQLSPTHQPEVQQTLPPAGENSSGTP